MSRPGIRPGAGRGLDLVTLQALAGNSAVSSLLSEHVLGQAPSVRLGPPATPAIAVQRCGPVPCDCPAEERPSGETASEPAGATHSVQRACGPKEVGKHDSCEISFEDLPPGASPYLFDVNCDTLAAGQEARLRHDVRRGDSVEVHGFASIEGPSKYNDDLSCARAEHVAHLLSVDIGATVSEIDAHGAVPGARVPRRSVVVSQVTAPPAPRPVPPSHVCGPDIDDQLTAVLADMQAYFAGLSHWRSHWSCMHLINPLLGATNAWDIHQLFLPETDWLRAPPFLSSSPPCGLPPASGVAGGRRKPAGGIEDPNTCSNSVRVSGKCNLAGTVNYATFGIMMKECHDYYEYLPWYNPLSTNTPLFTQTAVKALIGSYKTLDSDDPGPPTAFAVATYENGPSGRPSTENRANCSSPCEVTAKPPSFTFVWEPYRPR